MAGTEGSSLPLRLQVDVIRASKVSACDPNGKSDPYCIVYLGSTEPTHKTEIKSGTLDPVWNETFSFQGKHLAQFVTVSDSTGDLQLSGYIVFDVWDHDVVNPDDFLGRVMIPLREIPPDTSVGETWYPLTSRSAKDSVSGSLCVRTYLRVDSNKTLEHDKMDTELYQVCKSRGYHLPICSGKSILEFPGCTEHIEMAFSHVFVDVSSYHCTAQVYLTNYRLLILSTSNHQQAPSRFHGHGSTMDLSMWIALNNIMSVDMGTEASVIRKSRPKTQTMAITVNCYDFRSVKLVFILDDNPQKYSTSLSQTGTESLERGQKLSHQNQPLTLDSPKVSRKILRLASETVSTLKDGISTVGSAVSDLTRSMSEAPKTWQKSDDSDRRRSTPDVSTKEFPCSLRPRSDAVLEDSTSLEKMHLQPHLESAEENMIQFSDSSDDEPYDIDEVTVEFDDVLIPPSKGDLCFSEDQIEGGCGQMGVLLNPPRPTSTLVQTLFMRLEHLVVNVACYPPAQFYTKMCRDVEFNGWDLYNFPKEMDRQGVSEKKWRLTIVNGPQYSLCPSYPQLMYVPASVKDETLVESAKFRSRNRLPCLVWVDSKHQNFMMRCAQPLTGTSGKHSIADEQLIQSALDCGPCDSHMTIFDARSYSAATGNKIMGKGTEDISHYARARLTHLDIPNIHAVRESYEALRSVCLSTVSGKWHSALESTQWLNYISAILKGSTMIARCMKLRQGNVLVHCSDGWDRTSQLTSLAQLMMDYHYRTINGFMILIEKEWLSFGHKFQERLGDPSHPNERSPIFLQFLDCVHQLICQFPSTFEFTSSMLLCIAEHLNTAWFGTFLCNCDRERHDLVLYARTVSVWAHIMAEREKFLNPDYSMTTELIFPTRNLRRLRLWEEYFLRYDCTALAQQAKMLDHDMIDQEPIALTRTLDRDSWSADTVVWMSDSRTSECCTCQQKFNTFRRRHHCRACGRIFCHECSKSKVVLNHLGYFSPVRVCEECHRKLNRAQQTSETEDGFVLVSTND